MLKIDGVSDQIIKYLTDIGISDDISIIEALEAYKFVDREQILEAYNASTILKYKVVNKDIIEKSEFSDIEQKYGVFLEKVNDRAYNLYALMFSDIPLTSIELALGLYDVQPYYITPYNYNKIKNPAYAYKYNTDVLFKRILMQAIALHATDLHFDVKHIEMEPVYTISYRRDADILQMELFKLDRTLNADIISKLIETKTGVSSLDLLDPSGVVASASNILGDNDVELRISANRVKDGYHYVIRIQQKETFSFTLNKLGFAPSVMKDLFKITKKRNGITLITGAIRTGKNTTAFALANEMKDQPIKIISYESPIEVLMPFTQVDYLGDENVLLNAVRLAKKQDVNIAFLNEIPNKEVAFAIRDLANSSVHVITTMHMNRLWHLPYKLKEYYGDDYKDIISQINGVFNQKMYGVNCKHCRTQMLTSELKDEGHRNLAKMFNVDIMYDTKGCDYCGGLGVQPGVNQPYVEHLIFTEELTDKLLACDHPYQMEVILRDAVRDKKQSLEDYMIIGFQNGDIPLYALDQIC